MDSDPTPQNDLEAAFARVMLAYYRRAGPERAQALLDRLAAEFADGATRADLVRMAADELMAPPGAH